MEAAIPGFLPAGWYGTSVPAGAPPATAAIHNCTRLSDAISGLGYTATAVHPAPDSFTRSPEPRARLSVQETERWRRTVEIAGIGTEQNVDSGRLGDATLRGEAAALKEEGDS
jgi:hypothetical protein